MPGAIAKRFSQRRASTIFLRVPSADWQAVSRGRIREFRASPGNVPQLWGVPLPTLVVAYRQRRRAEEFDHRLMLLEDVRTEALGAITEEGLTAAGYTGEQARPRFRRDWMIRHKRRFEPLHRVMVFTVRPVQSDDIEATAVSLVAHLYGDFLREDANGRAVLARAGA